MLDTAVTVLTKLDAKWCGKKKARWWISENCTMCIQWPTDVPDMSLYLKFVDPSLLYRPLQQKGVDTSKYQKNFL